MTSLTKLEPPLPKVGKKEANDGTVHFSIISVGEMGIFPFPGILLDGPAQRVTDIKNMETRTDDIILVTFPKSGEYCIDILCIY